MKEFLKWSRKNFMPPYSSKRIIIFESDDWGAEVIPNQSIYSSLVDNGLPLDKDPYSKFDNIANKHDLECLFNALSSFRDINGNTPLITANVNMGNPDFVKIKESNFNNYFWFPLDKTLEKYSTHGAILEIWKNAISNKLLLPQLHGREHLNVIPWLADLKERKHEITTAFDSNVSNINVSYKVGNRNDYRAAFDFSTERDIDFHYNAITQSAQEFERIFGFKSKSIIAPCYTWADIHENYFYEQGIELIQGASNYKCPQGFGNQYRINRKRTFSKNINNQTYLTRNVILEPAQSNFSNLRIVSDALYQVGNAFMWGKPAVVSFHRLNFIGSRVEKNRTVNIKILEEFINSLLKNWPDVEFKSTVDMI